MRDQEDLYRFITTSRTRFWGEGSETIMHWAKLGVKNFYTACFFGVASEELSRESMKELEDLSGCFFPGVSFYFPNQVKSSWTTVNEGYEIEMETARNIPFGLFDRIATLFPRIHAEGIYVSRDDYFLGTYVIENGRFLWIQIDWPVRRSKGEYSYHSSLFYGDHPHYKTILKVLALERGKLKGVSSYDAEFKELLDRFKRGKKPIIDFCFLKLERDALLGDNESQFNLYQGIVSGEYYRSKTLYGGENSFGKRYFFNTPNMMEESWLRIAAFNNNTAAFETLKNRFENKAEKGNSEAMLSLSCLYQGKDDGIARYWLDRAIEAGDFAAKKIKGDYLCLGKNGYIKDSKLAVELWNAYCYNQTIIDPQYYFYCAISYHTGYGVSKDESKYNEMVEQLSLPNYLVFSLCFAKAFLAESEIANEIGIKVDPEMAQYWLKKGCEAKDKNCMIFLAKESLKGERIKKDCNLAFKLLNTLWQSENPDQEVCFYAGICYENGFGVAMNKYRAYTCYSMVAENNVNYEKAQIRLRALEKEIDYEKYTHDTDSKYRYALSIIDGCMRRRKWFERETKIAIRLLLEINPWRDSVKELDLVFAELPWSLSMDMDSWTDDTFSKAMDNLNEFSEFEIIKEKRNSTIEDYYNYACSKLESGQLDKALAVFKRISTYRDCSEEIRNIKERKIKKAIRLFSKNENEKANEVINEILSWEDYSQEEKDRCLQLVDDSTEEAKNLFLKSKLNEAVRVFANILLK